MTVARQNKYPRIAFLFKGGRRQRLNSPDQGPREFFYGVTEIPGADLIDEDEFSSAPSSIWTWRVVNAIVARLAGFNPSLAAKFMQPSVLSRLNAYDVLAVATNSHGLALALLGALGRLKAKVLFIPMGVLPLGHSPWRRALYKRLLCQASLAPLSLAEKDYLAGHLDPRQDIECLPFGVDLEFWKPGQDNGENGDYVLSIGNDWNRDYAALAAAWRGSYPLLKVVTSRPMPKASSNVSVIAGDWKKQLLSDLEVLRLYQGARFVVLPIRQTIQPAGQSACLQAMACGKAVVISDILGLWNRDVMIDGQTCLLAPPGSVKGLSLRIEELLNDPGRALEIGRKAREAVAKNCNLDIMADALKRRIEALPRKAQLKK